MVIESQDFELSELSSLLPFLFFLPFWPFLAFFCFFLCLFFWCLWQATQKKVMWQHIPALYPNLFSLSESVPPWKTIHTHTHYHQHNTLPHNQGQMLPINHLISGQATVSILLQVWKRRSCCRELAKAYWPTAHVGWPHRCPSHSHGVKPTPPIGSQRVHLVQEWAGQGWLSRYAFPLGTGHTFFTRQVPCQPLSPQLCAKLWQPTQLPFKPLDKPWALY